MKKKRRLLFLGKNVIMKGKFKKQFTVLLLIFTMLVALAPVSVMTTRADADAMQPEETVAELELEELSAEKENLLNPKEEQNNKNWEEKISKISWEKIESAEQDDKIPVWIWFTDIDQQEIDKQVEKDTGLSVNNLAVSYESLSEELKEALVEQTTKAGDERQSEVIEETIEDYISSYAFAWSIENSTFDLKHQLAAAATDLTFDNAAFHYTTIRFSDSLEFFNGRNLYVVIKKHNSSGVIFTSPIYTVAMNASSTGTLTHIATSARSFAESEYIEILMYSDSATQNLISRQLLRPVVFDMSN